MYRMKDVKSSKIMELLLPELQNYPSNMTAIAVLMYPTGL